MLNVLTTDSLIGLSPGIVRGINKKGVPADRVALVPNGCDLDIFGVNVERWRPDGIRETDLLAVFSGTHGLANGLDAALDAAAELKRRGRDDIKILLIGNGRQKPQLQHRALEEGIDNVIFHDPVDKRPLSQLMAATDIGLQVLANHPAFYCGTSPNKFFDYIAAGLPILNNYPGWLADLIAANRCGFPVPPDSPGAFADALEAAADDRPGLKRMGDSARRLALRQFGRGDLAAKWVDWLVGVVQPTRHNDI